MKLRNKRLKWRANMHAAALVRTELNAVVLTRLSPYHNTLFMRVGKSFWCLKKIQEFFQLCLT